MVLELERAQRVGDALDGVALPVGEVVERVDAPLVAGPVVRDLATDMDPFFDKWVKAEGVFHPTKTRNDRVEAISSESEGRRTIDEAIEFAEQSPAPDLSELYEDVFKE